MLMSPNPNFKWPVQLDNENVMNIQITNVRVHYDVKISAVHNVPVLSSAKEH
jgi:hypothetical protein